MYLDVVKKYSLNSRGRVLNLSKPVVMGILNVTPDSFSDGGQFFNQHDKAILHAQAMIEAGAKIIDVGGESTRPGALPITEQEEMDRVLPVVEALVKQCSAWISIDTSSPAVIREAVSLGAHMQNDVRSLSKPGAIQTIIELQIPVCLMHMQGEPQKMQQAPTYHNVVGEVCSYLHQRIESLLTAGVPRANIMIDPGFGFGKDLSHNLTLLANLHQLKHLGCPLLIGVSRKSMIGHLTGAVLQDRLPGSLVAAMWGVLKGAHILRVHDVAETVQALRVLEALLEISEMQAYSATTVEETI